MRTLACLLALVCPAPASAQAVSDIAHSIAQITVDPAETYRVRDVRLRKGDVSIYLNEGVIAFATPVQGRRLAAVFITQGVDAGDAEILLMPPQPAERASLASFTRSPNLDEHFSSAVFFFSDSTRDDILKQIENPAEHKAPDIARQVAANINPVLQTASSQITTRLLRALLGAPAPDQEFFFSVFAGRQIGGFDFLYEPAAFEPVTAGSVAASGPVGPHFQLWTAYRPKGLPADQPPAAAISNYRIDATIATDLSLSVTAEFDWKASSTDGRAILLSISHRLRIESASVDGQPVELFQASALDFSGTESDSDFLVVPPQPVIPNRIYRLSLKYSGQVIRQVSDSSYFVGERSVWYPHTLPMLTTFDLTFHCPARFQLVATGEPVSDEVRNDIRTVHRKTSVAQQLAGFNLGEYKAQSIASGPYRIECYADRSAAADMNNIPQQCEGIVEAYSRRWTQLPIQTLAVTPIPGYFGQGFPGLIYLSTTAYLPERERPLEVRSAAADTFFSDVLLPHEVAHQWWGNLVSSASYRADWLMESMANYSALQLLEENKGPDAMNTLLNGFRNDLNATVAGSGQTVDATGPVDFGVRLLSDAGERVWHVIVYEKGTWIQHMLRERMGAGRFREMQVSVLRQYAGQPLSNEQFRRAASAFLPPGQPDADLSNFFETWVYGTGIPSLRLGGEGVEVSGVDDEFTVDVPLDCKASGRREIRWLRVVAGTNPLPPGARNCHLPKPTEFLYISPEK